MTHHPEAELHAEFEVAWEGRPVYMGASYQKELAMTWWMQAARRAPVTPVPKPDTLRNAEQSRQMEEIALLVRVLVRALRKANPESTHATKALGYLKRHGLQGNPLRELPSDGCRGS